MKDISNPYITLLEQEVKVFYGWYKKGDGFKNDKSNPLTKKKINIYDETEYDIGKNNKIFKSLDKIVKSLNGKRKEDGFYKDSNLSLHMVTKVCRKPSEINNKNGHYICTIYGGLNGPGKWEKYCRDFTRLFIKIKNSPLFDHAYFCRLNNDCSDDVFTAYIGFTLKK